MSISLVKKSLQLLESSNYQDTRRRQKQPSHLSNSPKTAKNKVEGISKKVKPFKSNSRNTTIIKNFQKLQNKLKEEKRKDRTEENLKRLQTLSESPKTVNSKALEFFKRATKNKELKIEKVEEEQSTVFTEEDFARFEREYDFD